MPKPYKPNGYNSVSAYMMGNGAQRRIDMLVHIFDATEKRRYTHPDGSILHTELALDDSIIMLAEAKARLPAYSLWMHIPVPDVDSTFTKAVRLGCEVIKISTQKQGNPDCRGTFRDFLGYYGAIGTQL